MRIRPSARNFKERDGEVDGEKWGVESGIVEGRGSGLRAAAGSLLAGQLPLSNSLCLTVLCLIHVAASEGSRSSGPRITVQGGSDCRKARP